MFQIGDKIFYPNHGAGIIETVEEKEFLGEKQLYCVLNMLLRELQVMVPLDKMSDLGIRLVVDEVVMEGVLAVFTEGKPDLTINAAQRNKINVDKMKRGDIYGSSEVIRDLFMISKKKVLGTGDKIMLDNAQQLFISEIELVKGINTEQASALLKKAIGE